MQKALGIFIQYLYFFPKKCCVFIVLSEHIYMMKILKILKISITLLFVIKINLYDLFYTCTREANKCDTKQMFIMKNSQTYFFCH